MKLVQHLWHLVWSGWCVALGFRTLFTYSTRLRKQDWCKAGLMQSRFLTLSAVCPGVLKEGWGQEPLPGSCGRGGALLPSLAAWFIYSFWRQAGAPEYLPVLLLLLLSLLYPLYFPFFLFFKCQKDQRGRPVERVVHIGVVGHYSSSFSAPFPVHLKSHLMVWLR